MADKALASAIQPDGTLHNVGRFIHWTPGSNEVTLDGDFTVGDLRSIADHMDTWNPRGEVMANIDDLNCIYVARESGKLGGDGLIKIATMQDGRWVVEPDIERELQAFLDREEPDNITAGVD